VIRPDPHAVHEATMLKLDSSKARTGLDWRPRWNFNDTIHHTMEWYRNFSPGKDMRAFTHEQIDAYRSLEAAP
jgi:CDP-glucose 4,6-dehydratase